MVSSEQTFARSLPAVQERSARRRVCPLCFEARVDLLHTQRLVLPAEFALPEAFDIVTCVSCGMAYSDTTAESDRLTAHYRADSYTMCNWEDCTPDSLAANELGPPLDVARLRVVVEDLEHRLPSRDLRLLDVGCASGTLLALLGAAGFTDVQGIDPSASAVALAHQRGQRARVADVNAALPSDLGTFDVVVISHVLEHLGRPQEALKNLRSVLRPGGLIYAEVPDAARYAEFLVEPFVDFNHEHVNHFSMAHLGELFRASGFVATAFGRKTITVVDWPYPVIYGLWRMLDESVNAALPLAFDGGNLRDHLKPYVRGSQQLLEKYDGVLRTKLQGRCRVAVRCLGYRAWTLLANTILRDLDIVAFIDNAPAKQKLTVQGIRVTGPDMPLAADIPIIVLAYHVETAVVSEYAASDPTREVITIGRSRPFSEDAATAVDDDVLTGQIR